MKRLLPAVVAVVLCAETAGAQSAMNRPMRENPFQIDGLFRQEWTRDFFDPDPTDTTPAPPNESRQRGQLRPRLVSGSDRLQIGVGGDFNYSSDKNTDPNGDGQKPALLRDNYDSRDARLDLAFVHLQPLRWLQADGGQFAMPFGVTEMIWDHDLRVRGGAVRLSMSPTADVETLSVGGLYSRGSHVFDDGKARLLLGNATLRLKGGADSHFEIVGSILDWKNLGDLEAMIRRQNSRTSDGLVPDEFRVVDVVGRIFLNGTVPVQLVGDVAWNTKQTTDRKGLWLAVVLGSLQQSPLRAEYTYARVDRNATVAAYNTDDFFWGTGWEGHRLELGTRSNNGTHVTLHAIGQRIRFKDSTNVAEQSHWIQRYRIELRLKS